MPFPQFRHLPPEIRLEIWRQCLPNRVVELDNPNPDIIRLNKEDEDYSCRSSHTALMNRRPPVISRVCRESRMVALEHVNLPAGDAQMVAPDLDFGTFMGAEDWVDKHRDVLLLNYDRSYDCDWPEGGDGVVHFFLQEAAAKARDASLTSDFYYNLMLEPQHIGIFRNKRFLVCIGIATIHAPLQPALESGLFGLLG